MIKRLLAFLVLIVRFCCGCSGNIGKVKNEIITNTFDTITNRGKMIVGVKTDTFPFGYINENGEYAGYDVDLAKLIAKEIFGTDEGKVEFVPVTASDRMMKLYSEEVDMIIATMSITPSRLKLLDFSDPYYIAGQALLVNTGSQIKGIRDLEGKKAITVFGSTSEKSLRMAVPNAGIMGYKTYDEAYKALKERKAEAIVSDDTILIGLSLKDPSVTLLPKKYSKEPYAIAFRRGRESEDIIRFINRVIEESARYGKLQELQKKHGISNYQQ